MMLSAVPLLMLSMLPFSSAHSVSGALVNTKSTQITKNLMAYLTSIYGKHILSGQQDPNSYVWVQNNIGKSPAIIGLDMMDYSPSRVAYGSSSTAVEQAISYDGSNTIINFVWHWNAPTGLINSASEPWYSGFYTAATTFNLANALANKSGNDYALILRDIDAIATQLKRLQSANVPVIWRPLHEAEGGWFWWGRDKNASACKELYRIMYDRMTNYHGLNNLIWVWNSISSSWYPGDDVVDILSVDSYPSTGDHGTVSGSYNSMISLGGDKKLVALSEVGEIPDPAQLSANHIDWSYFVTWNGDYISGSSHNPLSYVKSVYTNAYVYNRDNISGWKTYSGGTTSPTTAVTTTTKSTTTTTKATTTTSTTSAGGGSGTAAHYGQCGGTGWTGPTKCESPYTCTYSNAWYSQCL